MQESDLYLPLKTFLEKQDYQVKGEVENCDVVAIKDDSPPTIVELKLSLNLDVILQAVDRLKLSPIVYIGVPHSCGALKKKKKKRVVKLLKMLGLGLIAINPKRNITEIVVSPTKYTPKQSKPKQQWLISEFVTRTGDPNLGGASTKTGRITAYKQQAIEIAHYLKKHGATKASDLAKTLDIPKSRNILYDNHYGWFEGLGKGIYQLTKLGSQSLEGFQE
ncbi:MAG: DUF2161 family putative PD-(D/E)XK-type phosphodiesterase [Pseudomonadota bacterium]|jgi:hypothetical protein|nr:DUF2161 family putative PD-(D/E)XK-type phosphodiesterase [Pseudomonadales bacterium]MEE3289970.1 DUF2161 family putative PD-(D/E)XK-type phosphodiesterase [Pseudomonadota bacterium]GIT20589.1 MAG: hypothetical protein CM1200mP40_02710 [Gammaproteobacteria bacterium]